MVRACRSICRHRTFLPDTTLPHYRGSRGTNDNKHQLRPVVLLPHLPRSFCKLPDTNILPFHPVQSYKHVFNAIMPWKIQFRMHRAIARYEWPLEPHRFNLISVTTFTLLFFCYTMDVLSPRTDFIGVCECPVLVHIPNPNYITLFLPLTLLAL